MKAPSERQQFCLIEVDASQRLYHLPKLPHTRDILLEKIGRHLFRVSRSNFGANIIGLSFKYLSWAMPVSRVSVDRRCIVFRHPKPICGFHLLIVPKQKIHNLAELFGSANMPWREAVIGTIERTYMQNVGGNECGCYILVNGKSYQDVMQLHFHCMSKEMGNGHQFDTLPSLESFFESMDVILRQASGVLFSDQTIGSVLSQPAIKLVIDRFFSDPTIKGFALFSVVGSNFADQRVGFRWSIW